MKKTLVIGASPNPQRYAHKATIKLKAYGHEVIPLGIKDGVINGIKIIKGFPEIEHVDTITLYIGPKNQPPYYDYILGINPKRIIFNPGTENKELFEMAQTNGIEVVEGCTLVMLSFGEY